MSAAVDHAFQASQYLHDALDALESGNGRAALALLEGVHIQADLGARALRAELFAAPSEASAVAAFRGVESPQREFHAPPLPTPPRPRTPAALRLRTRRLLLNGSIS